MHSLIRWLPFSDSGSKNYKFTQRRDNQIIRILLVGCIYNIWWRYTLMATGGYYDTFGFFCKSFGWIAISCPSTVHELLELLVHEPHSPFLHEDRHGKVPWSVIDITQHSEDFIKTLTRANPDKLTFRNRAATQHRQLVRGWKWPFSFGEKRCEAIGPFHRN